MGERDFIEHRLTSLPVEDLVFLLFKGGFSRCIGFDITTGNPALHATPSFVCGFSFAIERSNVLSSGRLSSLMSHGKPNLLAEVCHDVRVEPAMQLL